MARLRPILKALAAVGKRERQSFRSIASNNFFLAAVIFLQQAGVFLYLLGALAILFPLSADPLRRIPAERLALWPLTPGEKRWLRFLSPWINPVTWLLGALAAWSFRHTESRGVFALLAALFAVGFLAPSVSGEPAFLRGVPSFGNQLIRKNLREMALTLDFYMALLLGVSGLAYRLAIKQLPDEALMMMSLLIVLALSSYAQCLFGLESAAGLNRYRLMPLAGWRILAWKDVSFLIVVAVLTLPLSPVAGLSAALAALTVGHATSVGEAREQTRWRFSSGASFGSGITQTVALVGAGVTAYRVTPWALIPLSALCAASAWWFGRRLLVPSQPV